jgi:hypothetical protein
MSEATVESVLMAFRRLPILEQAQLLEILTHELRGEGHMRMARFLSLSRKKIAAVRKNGWLNIAVNTPTSGWRWRGIN